MADIVAVVLATFAVEAPEICTYIASSERLLDSTVPITVQVTRGSELGFLRLVRHVY